MIANHIQRWGGRMRLLFERMNLGEREKMGVDWVLVSIQGTSSPMVHLRRFVWIAVLLFEWEVILDMLTETSTSLEVQAVAQNGAVLTGAAVSGACSSVVSREEVAVKVSVVGGSAVRVALRPRGGDSLRYLLRHLATQQVVCQDQGSRGGSERNGPESSDAGR